MRAATVVAAAVVAGAVAPAGAGAVEVSVKGDDAAGTPIAVPLGAGPTIRNLNTEVSFAFTPAEANLWVTGEILDPANQADGDLATIPCRRVSSLAPRPAPYHGNGAYKVNLRLYAANDKSNCTGSPQSSHNVQYTVNAFTALGPVPGTLLTRKPGDPIPIQYEIPVQINPGASWAAHEVHYALNAQPGPNGPTTPGKVVYPDEATQRARVRFQQPGQYLFMARVRALGGVYAPWSQPVSTKVVAPFDLKSRFLTWTDNRGPSYRVKVRVVEPGARGKVTFRLARGKKRGRYRRIGTARISRRGTISKRFKVRRTGHYRLRISYKGNDLVAGGHVTFRVRFKRRIIFRSSASSVG